jgi:glycosyltransferase involved in cell wall biosynthesis
MKGSVRIIGKLNGVGLSRDSFILEEAMRALGLQVEVLGIGRRDAALRRSGVRRWLARRTGLGSALAPVAANVMLEHVWPQYLHAARQNILVPNPEWLDHRDRRHVGQIDHVWAKTGHALRAFGGIGSNGTLLGFDSLDRFDPSVPRRREFLHLAGSSSMKGTRRVLECWYAHPQWPRLTVVGRPNAGWQAGPGAGNVTLLTEYLEDAQLRELQNANLFHLCPSEAEGWGHYIVEAMSCAAVVITLDSPPMNELVADERGLRFPALISGRQNLVDKAQFPADALAGAVERAMQLDERGIARLGGNAREWMLANKAGFPSRLRAAVGQLGGFA